jgi:type IV secretory pathway VirD2 relaxase
VTTRDEDSFRTKLSPPRSRGSKPQSFIKRVLTTARHSGKTLGKVRYAGRSGKRPGARLGRGHAIAQLANAKAASRSRRAIVKARIVQFKTAHPETTIVHLRYIQRDAVGREGGRGELYTATKESADAEEFDKRGRGDRHQFRFIVSPEDAAEIGDLKPFTRELMQRVERDLGTELDWVAVDHWDTDNPHTHIVIRGAIPGGEDLIIASDYISHGLRLRAAELATEWLGERTTREILESLNRQITQERWTQLDQTIKGRTHQESIDLARLPHGSADRLERSQLLGRLQHLSQMGLADEMESNVWRVSPQIEPTLRAMGERGDIIRMMQRSVGRSAQEFSIVTPSLSVPIVGRITGKGLADEMRDQGYLIIDGVDGRAHYVTLSTQDDLANYPSGAIVEVRGAGARAADVNIARVAQNSIYRTEEHLRLASQERHADAYVAAHGRRLEALRRAGIVERMDDGVWRVPSDLIERGRVYDRQHHAGLAVGVQSYIPVGEQARAIGATWLDRELLRSPNPAGTVGFGAELRQALEERGQFLVEEGFAKRQGQRLVLMQNLLSTLRSRELNRVAGELESQTGLAYREAMDGERVSGVYKRSLMLASGRYALLDDGSGFALVPWRPVIEPWLGRSISAVVTGGQVSWEFGRSKGISR